MSEEEHLLLVFARTRHLIENPSAPSSESAGDGEELATDATEDAGVEGTNATNVGDPVEDSDMFPGYLVARMWGSGGIASISKILETGYVDPTAAAAAAAADAKGGGSTKGDGGGKPVSKKKADQMKRDEEQRRRLQDAERGVTLEDLKAQAIVAQDNAAQKNRQYEQQVVILQAAIQQNSAAQDRQIKILVRTKSEAPLSTSLLSTS